MQTKETITLSGVPVALLLMGPVASSLVAVLAVCALWGCCSTAFNVAFQAELIKYTPADSSAVAMSIFSGLFNLGIGTGTAIGGAVVSGPGIAWIALRAGRLPSWASSSPLRCCSRSYAAQSPSPNHVPSSVAVE